ncbi:hypothetical protein MNBD_ACTINO02-1602 [hydrothermal vent metagenome]|uniref:Uncharacterized protein n=1 Tax=hydrothermal vent metagenome TaxID=652676 RepID=A0A3B0SZP0_9ZZZZ
MHVASGTSLVVMVGMWAGAVRAMGVEAGWSVVDILGRASNGSIGVDQTPVHSLCGVGAAAFVVGPEMVFRVRSAAGRGVSVEALIRSVVAISRGECGYRAHH